jgi:hypothetical protein
LLGRKLDILPPGYPAAAKRDVPLRFLRVNSKTDVQLKLAQFCRFAVRAALLAGALAVCASAVDLKREAAAAFERYARQAESRIEVEIARDNGFLFASNPERRAQLRTGAILTESQIPRGELKVPSGLIHDWAGAVFLPDATLPQVLDLVQAYDLHREFYQPEVIGSRQLARDGDDFRVSLRLLKKKVLTVVLDTEHAVHYEQRTATSWWSRSRSTRIVEVQDPGTRSERQLPPDTGHGYMWRLNSYWTFQEMDGGTYVECEAISLTRDVPWGLRWLIEPIVRTLPRESLTNTLRGTRDGVSRRQKK